MAHHESDWSINFFLKNPYTNRLDGNWTRQGPLQNKIFKKLVFVNVKLLVHMGQQERGMYAFELVALSSAGISSRPLGLHSFWPPRSSFKKSKEVVNCALGEYTVYYYNELVF